MKPESVTIKVGVDFRPMLESFDAVIAALQEARNRLAEQLEAIEAKP